MNRNVILGNLFLILLLSGCFGVAPSGFNGLKSDVNILLSEGQEPVTSSLPIHFDLKFALSPDYSSISLSSIEQTGTATGVVFSLLPTSNGQTFKLTVISADTYGTIVPKLKNGSVKTQKGTLVNLSDSVSQSVEYTNAFKKLNALDDLLLAPKTYDAVIFGPEVNGRVLAETTKFGKSDFFSLNQSAGDLHVIDNVKAVDFSSDFSYLLKGSKVYFLGTDLDGDTELFVSDGTSASTKKLTNLNPSGSSFDIYSTYNKQKRRVLVELNSQIYFLANNGTVTALYKLDADDTPVEVVSFEAHQAHKTVILGVVNSKIVFSVPDSTVGQELWVSDGSLGNKTRISDITSGDGNHVHPTYNHVAKGQHGIYYAAKNTTSGLHITDGATVTYLALTNGSYFSDTKLIMSDDTYDYILADGAIVKSAGALPNTTVEYSANSVVGAIEYNSDVYFVYVSNGIYYLHALSGGAISTLGPDYNGLEVVSGKLLYAKDGSNGIEPHTWDGTTEAELADLYPGSRSSMRFSKNIYSFNGEVYFFANSSSADVKLYRTNGTNVEFIDLGDSTTYSSLKVSSSGDIYAQASYGSNHNSVVRISSDFSEVELLYIPGRNYYLSVASVGSDKALIFASDSRYGTEPWIFDGATGSFSILSDIVPGPASSNPNQTNMRSDAKSTDSLALFYAEDPVRQVTNLYYTDFSSVSTMSSTLGLNSGDDFEAYPLGISNTHMFFQGNLSSASTQRGMFSVKISDFSRETIVGNGTDMGWQFGLTGYSFYIFEDGAKAYFLNSFADGSDLTCSDGTSAGTAEVSNDFGTKKYLKEVAGNVIYINGLTLKSSQGCGAISSLADLSSYTSIEYNMIQANGKLFFVATDIVGFSYTGGEVWVTDGVSAQVLNEQAVGSFNDFSYFSVPFYNSDDLDYAIYIMDTKMYQSDGTDAGTYELTDFGMNHVIIKHIKLGSDLGLLETSAGVFFITYSTRVLANVGSQAGNLYPKGGEYIVDIKQADDSYDYYRISANSYTKIGNYDVKIKAVLSHSGGYLTVHEEKIYQFDNSNNATLLEDVEGFGKSFSSAYGFSNHAIFIVKEGERIKLYSLKYSDL